MTRLSDDEQSIDMLLAYYSLGFKLSAKRVVETKTSGFWIFKRTRHVVRYVPRELDEKTLQQVQSFFQAKAYDAWYNSFPPPKAISKSDS